MQKIAENGEMVPDEGIEPPTFGLQNRCSTAELIRRPGCCACLREAPPRSKPDQPASSTGAPITNQARAIFGPPSVATSR